MESSFLLLLLTLLSTLFALPLIFSKLIKTHQCRKRPPGPKPWPIIGNLDLLLGSAPHKSLQHLSQKYGEIMRLKFGNFPVIVASSPKMAEQFLKVHDADFAFRPALAAGKYISYNYSDVSFALDVPYWRDVRRIIASEFLNARKLENLEQFRVVERRRFLSRLQTLARSGEPIMLRDPLWRYGASTICGMLFRGEYLSEVEMDGLWEMMNEWIELAGAFNIGDWIPWLGFLDLQGYVRRMKSLSRKMDRFFDYVIDDHLARRDGAGDDFIDALLQIPEDPNSQIGITRDSIKAMTMNLLVAGTNPSATTIEWAIREIVRQPRIMARAKEELGKVIGRKRWVEENDLAQLPYTNAIILETFRSHPLPGPHYAMEDCNVAGYDISKGTIVLINIWSICKDPNSWAAPEEFLPERFLGREIDVIGSNFAFLPFGSGRRMCPGYNLGHKVVGATLANLLHGFELKLADGMSPEDISMEERYGISTYPKHPLPIIFRPTLEPHLY